MAHSVSAVGSGNAYLDQNVFHVKPVSPRLMQGAQHLFVNMSKIEFDQSWKNKSLKILSKAFLFTSYLLTMQLSVIESLALGIIGMSGTLVQLVISKKNDRIEKYSIKLLACSLHSLTTFAISAASSIYLFKKENDWAAPKQHLVVSQLSSTAYLCTSALAQLYCTLMFNSIRGKQDNAPLVRCNQAVIEGTPIVFEEIARSMHREYLALGNRNQCNPRDYARNFVAAHPISDRDWVNDFELDAFINGHILRGLSALIDQYAEYHNFIQSDQVLDRDDNEVVLSQFNALENRYHDHLKTCVKEAVRLMYENQWAKYLDVANDFEDGKDSLECYLPDCTIPLANIAQLIEIEQNNCCPREFTHENMQRFNNRRQGIAELKPLVEALTPDDKELLVERLIKTSLFELGNRRYDNQAAINEIYQKISALSGDMHQGPLMTMATVDVETMEGGGHNYFGDSWREGVEQYSE